MNLRIRLLFVATLGLALLPSMEARAGVIQGVTISDVSSEYVSGGDTRRATNLVNGVGLFGESHTAIAAGSMWLTLSGSAGTQVGTNYVTFDLGSVHNLNRMKVWNYNEQKSGANILTRRGVKSADILTAGDDLVFSTAIANQSFTRAAGLFTNLYDTIDLGGVSARYVRINIHTNFGEGDFRVGLSKVLFIDDTVPPVVKTATHDSSGTRVTVQFSETVLPSTATDTNNYSITSGTNVVAVLGASLNVFGDRVELQTGPMDSKVDYVLNVQNVRDAANVISITNTQVSIDPELVLWLKADAGITTDENGNVTEWDDQSDFANNAIAVTDPTIAPAAVNGMPSVHFDGFSQMMQIPSTPSLVDNGDLTVYAVVSLDTLATSANHGIISKTPANQPASFDLQVVKSTGKINFVRGNGASSSSAQYNFGLVANQYYIVGMVMRGTNGTSYLNGNFNGTASHVAGIGDTGSPIQLGLRIDSGTRLQGNIAELVMYRSAISDADRSDLESYLGAKYGISVVPLAIVAQPASITRMAGQTASFGVTAAAGSPTIYYQWQRNTVNIPGATNATYTTPALTTGDNSAVYRVVVSTPQGVNVTSDGAILTVLADTQAPSIYSATFLGSGGTNVLVVFSEPIDSGAAANAANFSLNNGATVLSAAAGSTPNQVLLTTSPLSAAAVSVLTVSNILDSTGNTLGSASAVILPGNAALWVRADSGVFTDGSGLVNQWDDQYTNNNTVLQVSGGPSRAPFLVAGSMNGEPAIRFDGVSNYLEAASSPSLSLTGDMSLYVIANISDYTLGREIISKNLRNQPAPFDLYASGAVHFYRGNGTVNGSVTSTALPSAGQQHEISVIMRGTNVNQYLDGAGNGSGSIVTTISDAGNPLRIGSRDDLLQYMKGDIAEVLIFPNALSTSNRKLVDTYLGVKYFPLVFVQQPADVSVLEGQTATFSASASQGGAVFVYQWQRDGIDIPGATNASYTTPVLAQSDSGATFQLVVTVPGLETNLSTSASLTVGADTVPPTVISIGRRFWSQNQIVVVFSEAVDPTTATNAANYSIDNGAAVLSAAMGDLPNEVVLTTTPLTQGVSYSVTVQSVQDLYNNSVSPTTLGSGLYPASLALWLKADAGVTADESGLVSEWDDQSGNFNNFYQANGPDFMPTLVTSALNGLPVIRFDPSNTGATDYLAAASSPTLAITGDLTVYAVVNFGDLSQNREIIGKTSINLPASYDFYAGSSGSMVLYRGNGSGTVGHVTSTTQVAPGTPHIVAAVMSGTTATHYLDSIADGSATISAPLGDNGDPVGLGIRSDLAQHMNGDIAEILLFSSALSDADRAAIDSYLSARYGLLLGLPPTLSILQGAPGSLELSWPTPSQPFVLESATDLSNPVWTTVANTVTDSGGVSSVTITADGQRAFYRLRKQ